MGWKIWLAKRKINHEHVNSFGTPIPFLNPHYRLMHPIYDWRSDQFFLVPLFMSFPLTTTRAEYTFTIEGIIVAIVELNRWGKSVANDLDTVLEEVSGQMGDLTGYAVLYCDRMGIWDGVRLERGLAKFYELGETALEQAAGRLLHLIE